MVLLLVFSLQVANQPAPSPRYLLIERILSSTVTKASASLPVERGLMTAVTQCPSELCIHRIPVAPLG